MNKLVIKTSMIHGLSGLLIMCYSQCTKLSLLLLIPVTVYSKGQKLYKLVAFYEGTSEFLRGNHLIYAIPALAVLFTVVIFPPLLLIIYPLCYKVFALLRIGESAFVNVLCKIAPLEKLKPFFDSFQGSFKDEYRYFAGLYFLYRLTTLVSFAVFHSLSRFYMANQIQFIAMFLLHSWTQPYKKRWHNKLEAIIFATLATVNMLTIYIYNGLHLKSGATQNYVSVLHVMVAYIPFLFLLAYPTWKIFIKVKKKWQMVLPASSYLFLSIIIM